MRNFQVAFFAVSLVVVVIAFAFFVFTIIRPAAPNPSLPSISFNDSHPDISVTLNERQLLSILEEHFLPNLLRKQVRVISLSFSNTYPSSIYAWQSEEGEQIVYGGYTHSLEDGIFSLDIYLDVGLLTNEYGWDEQILASTGENMLYEILVRTDSAGTSEQLSLEYFNSLFNQIQETHPKRPFVLSLNI